MRGLKDRAIILNGIRPTRNSRNPTIIYSLPLINECCKLRVRFQAQLKSPDQNYKAHKENKNTTNIKLYKKYGNFTQEKHKALTASLLSIHYRTRIFRLQGYINLKYTEHKRC